MDAPAPSYYPPIGFNFKVTIQGLDGLNEGNFRDVSGLEVKVETTKVNEGGENGFAYQLPNRPTYSNLVLKRGLLMGSPVIQWVYQAMLQMQYQPRTLLIELCDISSAVLTSWNVVNAYPVSMRIDGLNAVENGLALESIELAYQYFTSNDPSLSSINSSLQNS